MTREGTVAQKSCQNHALHSAAKVSPSCAEGLVHGVTGRWWNLQEIRPMREVLCSLSAQPEGNGERLAPLPSLAFQLSLIHATAHD